MAAALFAYRLNERRVTELLTFHSGVGPDIARPNTGPATRHKNLENSNMHMKSIGIALALALLPMTAFAQSAGPQTAAPEARVKVRAACAADVQKFCANIERAKGAMRGCLEAHDAQLSAGCKAARAERAAARAKDKS